MKFCKVCDNMYYISIDARDSNKLAHYCRNCGDIDNDESNTEVQYVLNTRLKKEQKKFHHIINKFTKLDPTLPRVHTLPCPNEACSTNATDEADRTSRDVLYIRYDEENLKYLYMCTTCNHTWHT